MGIEGSVDATRLDGTVSRAFDWAAYGRPCFGERVSGDVAITVAMEDRLLVVLIDVLGHGTEAHALAEKIAEYIQRHPVIEPLVMIRNLHTRFKNSRGFVGGCAVLNSDSGQVSFAGVGNPSFRVLGQSRSTTLPVSAGIIGGEMRTPTLHFARIRAGEMLLGCTDGVSEGFRMEDYPQMFSHKVWAVARSIVHRFGKDYDDATCLVVRGLG